MESPQRQDERPQSAGEHPGRSKPSAPETPPDTSDHPSHEEEVGGKGAEEPAEMADEDRYRKGPGW